MAQEILVTYRAEVDQLTGQLNKVIAKQEEIVKEEKKGQTEVDKNLKSQEYAAKKRLQLLELEKKELAKLKQLRTLAFDPKTIADFDKKISEANKNIKLLGGSVKEELGGTASTIKSIGLGIASALGAAFTVDAIIQFGKASIAAFLQAEENAQRLRFAVTQVNEETEAVFNRLLQQSKDLQDEFGIFSDDQIQQSQAALANFGLLGNQIEQLTPKIIDLAAANRIDLKTATDAVIRGIEGQTRGLTTLGLKFDDTGTAIGNLNVILEKSEKFAGGAADASKTLAGQLEANKNRADELSESIGSKLAPTFVRLKVAIFGAVESLLTYGRTADKELASVNKVGREAAADVVENLNKQSVAVDDQIELLKKLAAEKQKEVDTLELDRQLRLRKQLLTQGENLEILHQIELQRGLVTGYSDAAAALEETQIQQSRILTEEKLRTLTLAELNKLLSENSKLNDIYARSNVDLIEKEIAARKKLTEAIRGLKSEIDKVNAETAKIKIGEIDPKTYAEAIAKIERLSEAAKKAVDDDINSQIEKLKAEQKYTTEAGKLIDQLREKRKELIDENRDQQITLLDQKTIDANKQLLAQLESLNFEEALLINADVIDANNRKLAKSFEELNEAVSSSASGAQVSSIQQRIKTETDLLNKAIANEAKIRIEAAQAEQQRRLDEADTIGIAENEKKVIVQETNLEIQRINKDTTDKQLANIEKLNQALREGGQSDVVLWFERNEQILDSSQQLFDALIELNSQYYDNRIQQINAEKDAQISALDFEQEKISENLSKRRISELEAQRQTEALTAKRLQVQAQAAKKERDLKRKQAEIEKAAAIIQIIINTAQASTRAYAEGGPFAGPALAALVGALGAAQLALVAAQPIPYEKGSKDTGSKGHMARVGEKGEEIVFMPAHSKVLPAKQTQNFGAALDAMYDNRFDKWVMEQYTAPVLVAQQKQHEKDQQQTFVKNIAQSFSVTNDFNTGNLEKAIRRGQIILNADDIGQSVAKHLQTDIYRR